MNEHLDSGRTSAIYGPVPSWRVGLSLGVDLICVNSVCSFNCAYCQLGSIQVRTGQRQLFVSTDQVLEDLRRSRWRQSDIITYSGSGEPTLAANLGECLDAIREETSKEQLVLTNGTLLDEPEVRSELCRADRVYLKLDAATESTFQRVNRPVGGMSLDRVVRSAEEFRGQYDGYLGIQMMFLYSNISEYKKLPALLRRLRPDEVQINTPTRPYPDAWYLASRGSHEGVDYPARPIKQVERGKLEEIAAFLRAEAPAIRLISVRGS